MKIPKTYFYRDVDIIDLIIKEFPEFKESSQFEELSQYNKEHAYPLAAAWAGFIVHDQMPKENIDSAVKALRFVDKIMNDPTSDPELINLLQIELFEIIVGTRKGLHLAVDNLHDHALSLLGMTMQHFRTLD